MVGLLTIVFGIHQNIFMCRIFWGVSKCVSNEECFHVFTKITVTTCWQSTNPAEISVQYKRENWDLTTWSFTRAWSNDIRRILDPPLRVGVTFKHPWSCSFALSLLLRVFQNSFDSSFLDFAWKWFQICLVF